LLKINARYVSDFAHQTRDDQRAGLFAVKSVVSTSISHEISC